MEGGHHEMSKHVANLGGLAGYSNEFVLTERERERGREGITLILLLVSFRNFV